MTIHVKTGYFTFDSAIGFETTWTSRTVNIFYMKNNSPLKGLFTRLKTKQKVRLKMALWNINNSQAKDNFYCGSGLRMQSKC
jgi:hypothetical protein